MNRRLLFLGALLLGLLIGGNVLIRAYDVEFLSYIVERTVMEKLDKTMDPARVQERFASLHQDLRHSKIGRDQYRRSLLEVAGYIEKVEVLHPAEVAKVFQYFQQDEKS